MNTISSPRRSILAAAIVSLTTLGAALTTEAATITWGAAQNITGDTDVSTAGTFVGALNLGPSAVNTTVNGVTFTGLAITGSGGTSGSFAIGTGPGSTGSGSASAPFSNLSASYQALLGTVSGGSAANSGITLTISSLVVGQQYAFQWWSNVSGQGLQTAGTTVATAGNTVGLQANPTGPGLTEGGLGQFAIGTFIADNATQVITFKNPTANSNTFVNGFQLRELSVATAVPEPGSALVGMLALGLCGLGSARRRRA